MNEGHNILHVTEILFAAGGRLKVGEDCCSQEIGIYLAKSSPYQVNISSHKTNCCGLRSPYFAVNGGHNVLDVTE